MVTSQLTQTWGNPDLSTFEQGTKILSRHYNHAEEIHILRQLAMTAFKISIFKTRYRCTIHYWSLCMKEVIIDPTVGVGLDCVSSSDSSSFSDSSGFAILDSVGFWKK